MQPIYLIEPYAAEEFNLQAELLDLLESAVSQLPVPEDLKRKARDINNELTARKAAREHRMGIKKSPWPYGTRGLLDWFDAAKRIPSKEIQASIVASHLCPISPSATFLEEYKDLYAYTLMQPDLLVRFVNVIKSDVLKVGRQVNEVHGLKVTWEVEVLQAGPRELDIIFHPKEVGPISFTYDPHTMLFRAASEDMSAGTGKTRLEAVIELIKVKGLV